MARGQTKAEKTRRRREAVRVNDRVGPTPETAAKLKPDPLVMLHEMGHIDSAERDAALEIRRVYMAIVGHLMPKARGVGGRAEMPSEIAWIHANRYLPWAARHKAALQLVIDLVVDAILPGLIARDSTDEGPLGDARTWLCVDAIRAYARARSAKPIPRNLDQVA